MANSWFEIAATDHNTEVAVRNLATKKKLSITITPKIVSVYLPKWFK